MKTRRVPKVAWLIKSCLVLLLRFMFASKLIHGEGTGYMWKKHTVAFLRMPECVMQLFYLPVLMMSVDVVKIFRVTCYRTFT